MFGGHLKLRRKMLGRGSGTQEQAPDSVVRAGNRTVQTNRAKQMAGSGVSFLLAPPAPRHRVNHIALNRARAKALKPPATAPAPDSMLLVSPASSAPRSRNTSVSSSRTASTTQTTSSSNTDFIKRNKDILAAASIKKKQASASSSPGSSKSHAMGKVPLYLVARKEAWAVAQRERDMALAQAHIPPGMRVMSDSEREQLRTDLECKKEDIQTRMGRMPILVETLRLKREVDLLQREMKRIDDALATLDRQFLYVSLEEEPTSFPVQTGGSVKSGRSSTTTSFW